MSNGKEYYVQFARFMNTDADLNQYRLFSLLRLCSGPIYSLLIHFNWKEKWETATERKQEKHMGKIKWMKWHRWQYLRFCVVYLLFVVWWYLRTIEYYAPHEHCVWALSFCSKFSSYFIYQLSEIRFGAVWFFMMAFSKNQIIYIWFISFHNCISLFFVIRFWCVCVLLYLFYCVPPKFNPLIERESNSSNKNTRMKQC